ncbi:MAG: hypothetical protein RAK20_06950, partial [Conexivisphaerales archaeon]|nr:hypothetical protein [Conexivisphaerales archaeon]
KPGQTVPLSSQVVNRLNRIFSNLTVVSSSLTYKGNLTSFSITVKNNGNEPVVVYAVRLFGEWQTQINAEFNSSQFEHSGFNFSNIFSQGVPAGFNGTMTHSMPVVFFVINNTLQPFPNAPVNPHRLHFFGMFKHMRPFNFTPNFQFNESEFNYTPPVWHGDFGIIVQPGQSVTLNFTGVITPLWHGWHFRSPWFTKIDIYTVPVNGYQYQIKLMSVPPSNSTYYVTAKEI